jgi:hypothetical protein
MNEIAYRPSAPLGAMGLEAREPVAPPAAALPEEDSAARLLAELRRDLDRQVEWRVREELAARRAPSTSEAVMMLGSLAFGTITTAVLVTSATTVVSGLFGSQSVSRLDTLPLIVMIWVALIAINLVWARRR